MKSQQQQRKMTPRQVRLVAMMALSAAVFVTEIVVGYFTDSMALIADSFHMLSDVLALVVALGAIQIAKRRDVVNNTFGWQRAELVGALINSVFLLALCFSIFLEAVQRFFAPPEITSPKLILIVGGIGLFSNVVGMLLFAEHGGHGHSHGGHGHAHNRSKEALRRDDSSITAAAATQGEEAGGASPKEEEEEAAVVAAAAAASSEDMKKNADLSEDIALEMLGAQPVLESASPRPRARGESKHTFRALFLHVLGDAMGSLGVIVSALLLWLVDEPWKYYMDPLISILIVFLLLTPTIPLVHRTAFILLQGLPTGLKLETIRDRILKVDGILAIHELHIWQLNDLTSVASVHLSCGPGMGQQHNRIAKEVKAIFHEMDVHSTTIQQEYFSDTDTETSSVNDQSALTNPQACLFHCGQKCANQMCCDQPVPVPVEWAPSSSAGDH